jgi:hypothetical protein
MLRTRWHTPADCWCASEPYRLPMTDLSEDCLCPDCLRKAAQAAGGFGR